eukprot:6463676-Amphidinium_carterae.2
MARECSLRSCFEEAACSSCSAHTSASSLWGTKLLELTVSPDFIESLSGDELRMKNQRIEFEIWFFHHPSQ